MLKSLIAQLLAGYHDFDVQGLEPIIAKKAGKMTMAAGLWRLFKCLILQLPRELFVLCIIHGVNHYEEQESERDIKGDSFLDALAYDRFVPKESMSQSQVQGSHHKYISEDREIFKFRGKPHTSAQDDLRFRGDQGRSCY